MEAALLVLFALAVLLFVLPSTPAAPEPDRIVIIVPEQPAASGGSILLILLLVLIMAVVLLGQ
jgi:hypothetical protein